jgi:excisionase family DNA binding protein
MPRVDHGDLNGSAAQAELPGLGAGPRAKTLAPVPDPERAATTGAQSGVHSAASAATLPPVLTADELAALLRVNRKTVYAAFRAGEIPGHRIAGTIRFSRDAVLRWLAEGQVSRSSRGSR